MRTTHENLISLSRPGWNILSWCAQLALASLCCAAIYQHVMLNPAEHLKLGVFRTDNTDLWHVHLVCVVEFFCMAGLVLPAAMRIRPKLTIYAAAAVLLMQIVAIGIQIYQGSATVLPIQSVYATLAMFVIWARTWRSPITPRG